MSSAQHTVFHWHTEPQLVLGLGLILTLYWLGVSVARARLAPGRSFPTSQACRFTLGLVLCYLAVGSPLDTLGERLLFSAHMAQHLLLIYAVPMLCLTGLPAWLVHLPLSLPGIRQLMYGFTRPWVVLMAFHGIFTAWHLPALYELALHQRFVHNLEHLSLILSASLLWWPVLSPLPQLPPLPAGLRVVYLLFVSIGQLPVFVYVTFTSTPLYATYTAAERVLALSPLEDQQLGGILMQTVTMVLCSSILAQVVLRWFHEEQAVARLPHTSAVGMPHIS